MIIAVFSSVAWDGLWQRHQQIMSRLAIKGHNIIYIEPTTLLQAIKKPNIFFNRIKKKDGIILVRPLYIPLHYKIRLLVKIDYLITSYLLNKALKVLDVEKVEVMWSFSPYFYFAVSAIKYKILIYDCADESEGFVSSELAKTWILTEEKKILKKADAVFVTSDRLFQRCNKLNSKVYWAPNGVPSSFFDATNKMSIPIDIRNVSHPIIGFVGSLANWLDYDILFDIAMNNKNFSFVLVGQINTYKPKLKDLLNLKNVFFLGIKKHQEIPAYIEQFDVCLIPFRIQGLTLSSCPIKLFEYFAMGKPVVSTKLDEVEKFKELTYIADHNTFSRQIKKALHEDNLELRRKRKEITKQFDWNKIVDTIDHTLVGLMIT